MTAAGVLSLAPSRGAAFTDNQAASLVIGQADMTHNGPNQVNDWYNPASATPQTLFWPGQIVVTGGRVYIADYHNNRILIYSSIPTDDNPFASVVVGQPNMYSNYRNQEIEGNPWQPRANTLHWADGVAISPTGKMLIADTFNNRTLVFNSIPTFNNQSANTVIGQISLSLWYYENQQGDPDANTHYDSRQVCVSPGGKAIIADRLNNRVLIFDSIPTSDNADAAVVVGQLDPWSNQTNQGEGAPYSDTLNEPSGVFVDSGGKLYITDTGNNRVLIFSSIPDDDGATAAVVVGQANFISGEPNRGLGVCRANTLCEPFGSVYSDGTRLFIPDSGNHRVLIYSAIPTFNGQSASVVLGQPSMTANYVNQFDPDPDPYEPPAPTSRTLYWPNCVFLSGSQLFVSDTNNNRALIYQDSTTPTPSPTPTPSATPTRSPSPPPSPTPTPSRTPTPSPTLTPSPTASPTKTPTPTPSRTPTASPTPTPSPSPSPSASPTASPSPSASPTPYGYKTPTPTPTSSPTPSVTPSPTPSATPTPTPPGYKTPTPTPTPSPSPSSSPTPTPSPSSSPTPTVSATPSPSPSPTATPSPTSTLPPTPTATPAMAAAPLYLTLASGDYDGDGTADAGIFRPADSLWSVRSLTRFYFGLDQDKPVSGDYDGDGTAEAGIFRAFSGLWSIRGTSVFYLGAVNDRAAPGDYDGDGDCDAAIFRPAQGLWALRDLSRIYFGQSTDYVLAADFSGEGTASVGIFRPASGYWAIRGLTSFYLGAWGDRPAAADLTGDGAADLGIFRPASILWSIRNVTRMYFGSASDEIVPADYDGDGTAEAAIFRPSTGLWQAAGVTRLFFGGTGTVPVTR